MSRNKTCAPPLPISWVECKSRGWKHLDILLVTGDAYIDHPSFGIALIGRLLESHGYKVAILSQPRYDSAIDFKSFPVPRLFCGITAGNLDSIVANYSGSGKVRDTDAYSANGDPWRDNNREKSNRRRPDRASIVYCSLAKSAYRGTPIILGGIEASLRRFVHYDYQQNKLRGSFLTDAKADLLVYGMGEKAVVEIAKRCAANRSLSGIAGTCEKLTQNELEESFGTISFKNTRELLVLPPYEKIIKNRHTFLEAESAIDKNLRAYSARKIIQQQQQHWVLQHPPAKQLTSEELDELYLLPFTRKPHPAHGDIPAHKMIENSVTIVRGCSGNCSFCAITRHQGPAIVSRSLESIVNECKRFTADSAFKGTITDLGGPTANLYGTSCAIGGCKKRDCLFPKLCTNLVIDEQRFLDLLKTISALPAVKNLFISSGLRMELLLKTPELFEKIVRDHTSGSLKIAPEHTNDEILELMHKEPHRLLEKFVTIFRQICNKQGKRELQLTPYVITSHPGSTPHHAKQLARDMTRLGLKLRKFQDFTPTPGTISTAMYVSGIRADNKKKLIVARKASERREERRIIEAQYHRRRKQKSVQRKRKRYRQK